MKRQTGFTLVEILVASTIMLMVFALVYTAFIQTRKIALRNEMDVEILQNARIGLDEMARKLRMIGYRRDREHGQVAFIEAAPFQITFNADIDPKYPALTATGLIRLYDSSYYKGPLQNYTTEAETIRWTFDRSGNGLVDKRDTYEKTYPITPGNPHDMVLVQEINGGRDTQITIGLLGPFDAYDQRTNIEPMFQYWLLETDNSLSLLGDKNNDQQLIGDERYFRSITSQLVLQKIQRIHITLTAESDAFDPFSPEQRRRVTLDSTVGLRNTD